MDYAGYFQREATAFEATAFEAAAWQAAGRFDVQGDTSLLGH